MFTGIVPSLGEIVAITRKGKGTVLSLSVPPKFKLCAGESLAVNGVCLTIKAVRKNRIFCDCLPETLKVTTLGGLKPGEPVNLEKPLTLQTPLGGHLVQGHVDGTGTIVAQKQSGDSKMLRIRVPKFLARYLVKKDSIAVDGISLTIVDTFSDGFSVSLVPMTLLLTTLGRKKVGDRVNLEVNLLARYTFQWLQRRDGEDG